MDISVCKPPLMPASCQLPQQHRWLDEVQDIKALSALNEGDQQLLAAIIAGSSHLHRMVRLFAGDVADILAGKTEKILGDAQKNWQEAARSAPSDAGLAGAVRLFRNRCHFAIALAELSGQMDISDACTQLSTCAEHGVREVADYLYRGAATALSDPAVQGRWVILGLGKLGAGELNYSSDIDLIILHEFAPNSDPNSDPDRDAQSAERQGQNFNRLARRLAKILSEDTADGFGWRVDFRLRPDPAATPLSLSLPAAVSYYESTARSWERAAFIRARPVAGDIALGEQFLGSISAFIWRRSFDYTVIDDLQIWLRHLPAAEDYLGFDVKLGQFGIRHIELLVHILQLLGGGRHRELRTPNTCTALASLVRLGWLEPDQARALEQHYFHWREIEHRLQYLRDTQTHKLPRDRTALTDFAAFCGMQDAEALIAIIQRLQSASSAAAHHPIFDQMVERAQNRQSTTPELLASAADHQVSLEWLASLGFARPHDMRDIIDGWSSGRIPATRGERARHYLFRLLPELITHLAEAGDPDAAFARFADLVAALPAGAQAFSLLCQHPQLASLITDILVKAPALTNTIGRRTDVLDILLEVDFFAPLEGQKELAQTCPQIRADEPVELYLDRLKRWTHEARFRANVHMLQKITPYREVLGHLSLIAEQVVRAVCAVAIRDFQARYGQIAGSGLHILALGRLGAKTMTARSDIDLLFIYDGETEGISDGPRSLGLSAYYIRLTQLIISWLTVASREGSLYEVDTRLRPDGKSGPAAAHLHRLQSYYATEAWPWEHIAIAKARLIASSNSDTDTALKRDTLQRDVVEKTILEKTISDIKNAPPSAVEMAADIIKMRDKLASETASGKPTGLGLKKRAGGLLDIEFLAILTRVPLAPDLSAELPAAACAPLEMLKSCQKQQPDPALQACIDAAARLEEVHAFSQLCLPRYTWTADTDMPSPPYHALAEITGFADLNALLTALEDWCKIIENSLLKRLETP